MLMLTGVKIGILLKIGALLGNVHTDKIGVLLGNANEFKIGGVEVKIDELLTG